MRVDGTEWIIQQVDVTVLVNPAGQADPLLLTPAQVDTLGEIVGNIQM